MSASQTRHPFDWLESLVLRHRRIILFIVFLLLLAGTITYIIGSSSCSDKDKPCAWTNDLIVCLSSLGTLTVFLQLILNIPGIHSPHESLQETVSNRTTSHNIVGRPLLTDTRTIEQRENDVEEIYEKLTQPDTTAVVLTGIALVGKSTLASLVYEYAERRRLADSETFFNVKPLWIEIDQEVTMTDIINTLYSELRLHAPDLRHLSPESQAAALLRALNSVNDTRLIILDQFDNLLNRQTGYALFDRPGMGEWLDVINSQPCRCHLLLTSRLWPKGTHDYPPTYLQEYIVHGLEDDEGVQLLRKQGLDAPEHDLRTISEYYDGHTGALKELASSLRSDPNLSSVIAFTLENAEFAQLRKRIARRLLASRYMLELNEAQSELMLAFSVYREPVTLEAIQDLVNFRGRLLRAPIRPAVDVLLAHHLLEACGDLRYQLHPVVIDYAQSLVDENNEDTNIKALQSMHIRAALYYRQLKRPSRGNRMRASDMHSLIEAVWHLCQGQQQQEAFDILNQEGVFSDLLRFEDYNTIAELCLLFLPFEKWEPERWQANQLNRNFREACLNLGKEEQVAYYDSLVAQWFIQFN